MAIIPAITTGMIDFIISSGLITLMAAIPVPLFAVPYAAPRAKFENEQSLRRRCRSFTYQIVTLTCWKALYDEIGRNHLGNHSQTIQDK